MNFQIKNLIKEVYSKENRLSSKTFLIEIGYPIEFVDNLEDSHILNSYPVAFPFENIELNGKIILDVGCGFGIDARYCLENGAECVIGMDLYWKYNSYRNEKFLRIIGDIEKVIPFKFGKFDLLLFNGSFNQIIKKFSVLKKIRNLLKKDGIVIICDLLWIDDISKKDIYKNDLYSWIFNVGGSLTEQEILNIVKATGYRIFNINKFERIYPVERVRVILRK